MSGSAVLHDCDYWNNIDDDDDDDDDNNNNNNGRGRGST